MSIRVHALAKELNGLLVADKPACDVVICTPFIHLASVAGELDANVIGLGAENCADKVSGAYTGEVSAEMVKSTGAQYVWQVSWYPPYGNKKYKSFANKQQAMIFMSKLKSGNNYFVDIEKWFGN